MSSFLLQKSNAQISLEYTFSGAQQKLFMVNLEASGYKYVVQDREENNRDLKFYNLDHSLWKTIDCNSFPALQNCGGGGDINYFWYPLYISQSLFDLDTSIEFMFYTSSDCRWFTGIYKEDGSAILEVDSAAPLVLGTVPAAWRPMYSTPEGTKLILSMRSGNARVYSVPGELLPTIDQLIPDPVNDSELRAFPNPAYYQIQIEFRLPDDEREGEIHLYDLSGHELKTYHVDKTFNTLLINENDVSPGTYLYSLTCSGKIVKSTRIVFAK
jgi:hypothetical protein